MNDNTGDADPVLATYIKLPFSRWGGDATTRYNWQVDNSNSGGDWYFMAGDGSSKSTPSGKADAFVQRARDADGKAILTVPIIDYIDKSVAWDCSFPVSIFGAQQSVNPFVHPVVNGKATDAGNGIKPDGSTKIVLTNSQILRVHVPNSVTIQTAWVKHLVQKFGDSTHSGVAIYQLDNEPSGWSNTHRDIHPGNPTYQEIVADGIKYASAIKAADPSSAILGPGDFGWPVYVGDPTKNGGLWNSEYYLSQFRQASSKAGKRLLDYMDEHYYPTSDDGVGGIANAPAGDASTKANRLRATRSLWDPTYVEKNWIGKYNGAIQLIPRMHNWVSKQYPGTKVAITEYNFGGLEDLNGALTQADVLGIFGRESVDLATIWGPPNHKLPGAFAFSIYRNYDGKGGRFGETSVQSISSDQATLSVFGSVRTIDGALTVVVINKSGKSVLSKLALSHFTPAAKAHIYRYSGQNLSSIVIQPDLPVSATGFSYSYPASSITLFVIPKKA